MGTSQHCMYQSNWIINYKVVSKFWLPYSVFFGQSKWEILCYPIALLMKLFINQMNIQRQAHVCQMKFQSMRRISRNLKVARNRSWKSVPILQTLMETHSGTREPHNYRQGCTRHGDFVIWINSPLFTSKSFF